MNHRGVEYSVLLTIPKGWRWSVQNGKTEISGETYSREFAVRQAQKRIDQLVETSAAVTGD